MVGRGLRLEGDSSLLVGNCATVSVRGGVNLQGREVFCERAGLVLENWGDATYCAYAGEKKVQGGRPSRVVLRRLGLLALGVDSTESLEGLDVEVVNGVLENSCASRAISSLRFSGWCELMMWGEDTMVNRLVWAQPYSLFCLAGA